MAIGTEASARTGEKRRVSQSASFNSKREKNESGACGEVEVRDEGEVHGQREVRGGRGERQTEIAICGLPPKQSRV